MNTDVIIDGLKRVQLNEEILDEYDVQEIAENTYHLIREGKNYTVEVISFDQDDKSMKLRVNGVTKHVQIKESVDLLVEKNKVLRGGDTKANKIKSPMPGLVLEVNIKLEQEVKKDDTILILEAMKMENILKSPKDGIIKRILCEQGQSVDKNQLLVELE